ncbi:anti-sigma factor domain-containing protein [Sporosarcina sp. NCCP-2222]|uniref:anti-sigma factor domain-containing protein n=1 Tax=Sporosarcina sp. NCCP-2222 TaxID=2935073 RepID=UPI0020C07FF5|nr:anti-sigma factor domain-containing protein [Sporosarcina sp. NCCP-2222]
MRTNRGIVCETKTAYTVFLTSEGEFVRGCPIGDKPEIGQEVEFHPLTVPGRKKPLLYGPVIAVAMLLVVLFASIYPDNEKALAYVQMESKAALEFGVDQRGMVVGYHQFGETQKLVSEALLSEWVGLPIQDVLGKAAIEIADESGTEEMVVTLVFKDNEKSAKMKDIINNAIKAASDSQQEVKLQVVESSVQERNRAKKKDTSIQQYKKKQNNQPKSHSSDTDMKKEVESEKSAGEHNSGQIKIEKAIRPNSALEIRQNGQKKTNKAIIEKEPFENIPTREVAEKRQNTTRKTERLDIRKEIKSHAQKKPAGNGQKPKKPGSQNHHGIGNQKGEKMHQENKKADQASQ